MNATSKSRSAALFCVLCLLVCGLITHPVAEIGIVDDFSYAKSAEDLARTGHVVYNGWSAAMLGWQLYWGALFTKLFGPSFTAIRASTFLIALAIAFLVHRTMVRCGVNTHNATIGTLAFVFSPIFLPLSLTFMSDIDGLFCIVLCMYACLRALQASTDRATLAWLAFAALSNAVGGTVRQIAWLGVLVMFPSTVWLLRRRPRVVGVGALLYLVSAGIIFGALRWFGHQPYSMSGFVIPGKLDHHLLLYDIGNLVRVFFMFVMFLLPILVAFVSTIRFRNWRTRVLVAVDVLICVGLFLFWRHLPNRIDLLAPFKPGVSLVTAHGVLDVMPLKGIPPEVLTLNIRFVLTAVSLLALFGFFIALVGVDASPKAAEGNLPLSWTSLLILLVPFILAYLTLLLPQATFGRVYDRYLLTLIFLAILLLLRHFQYRMKVQVPAMSILILLIFAIFAVVGTHDAFSAARGRLGAIDELRSAGVPDNAIDAGFEHNALLQIEHSGYINDPRITVPRKVFVAPPQIFPDTCSPHLSELTPVMIPGYALSYDPQACGGPSGFAPITYRDWAGPHNVNLYIVRTFKGSPTTH